MVAVSGDSGAGIGIRAFVWCGSNAYYDFQAQEKPEKCHQDC